MQNLWRSEAWHHGPEYPMRPGGPGNEPFGTQLDGGVILALRGLASKCTLSGPAFGSREIYPMCRVCQGAQAGSSGLVDPSSSVCAVIPRPNLCAWRGEGGGIEKGFTYRNTPKKKGVAKSRFIRLAKAQEPTQTALRNPINPREAMRDIGRETLEPANHKAPGLKY